MVDLGVLDLDDVKLCTVMYKCSLYKDYYGVNNDSYVCLLYLVCEGEVLM